MTERRFLVPKTIALAVIALCFLGSAYYWWASTNKECQELPYMSTYCGVNCVRAICALQRHPLDWDCVFALVQPDKKGQSSFAELIDALTRLGFHPLAVRCGFADLSRFGAPAILHLNTNEGHFVVCSEIRQGKATIIELPLPVRQMTRRELDSLWDGTALVVYSDAISIPPSLLPHRSLREAGALRSPTAETAPSPTNIGSLEFASAKLYLGAVERYGKVSGQFAFRNGSASNIRLSTVRSECKCVANFRYPDVIRPGESGSIVFDIDVGNRAGPQRNKVYVQTDETNMPSGVLEVFYVARMDILIEPFRLDFGAIAFGHVQSACLSITNVFRGSGVIKSVEASLPFIRVGTVRVQDSYNIKSILPIEISSDAPTGRFGGHIKLVFEGAEDLPLTIPVTGDIQGPVTVTPREIAFGIISRGEQVAKKAVLAGGDSVAFDANGLEFAAHDTALDIKIEDVEPNRCRLAVLLNARGTDRGLIEGTIDVSTRDGRLLATIPYNYYVRD